MTLLSENPLYVFAILNLAIFAMDWLAQKPYFNYIGTALLVILVGALLSNLGLIPSASNSIDLYSGIFKYLAPLSIFYLLLEVNLKSLKNAGLPMLSMFFLGAIGTTVGAFIGMYLLDGTSAFGDNYKAVSGMFTGTYIGGSVNFNALAVHYNMMEQGTIYAGAVAVDNVITTLWMVVCIALPKAIKSIYNYKKELVSQPNIESAVSATQKEEVTVSAKEIGILLFLGTATMFLSEIFAGLLGENGFEIPSILIVTTLALMLAQLKSVSKIRGSRLLGLYSVYLFLIVIGAFCEIAAMASIGILAINLLFFALILVSVHALFIFGIGSLLKLDIEILSIASQANIGGSSTALALAKSFNRQDLLLPGILVGSLGNGLGTYIAFIVAGLI